MIRLLAWTWLLFKVYCYYIEVEDTIGKREAEVWGVIKLIYYQQDRKDALILEGGLMEHLRGEPPLTMADIDIMHRIESHIHRFEPEFMRPLDIQNEKNQMVMLAYESEKDPRWRYRIYIAPQLEKQIQQIRNFISSHHTQETVDLFQNVPEELRQELEKQHQAAIQQLQKQHQIDSQTSSSEL